MCLTMVMDTDNFLRAAKNKDIMTTRRYHCRASILYFLHCNLLDLEKKLYRESLNYIQKKLHFGKTYESWVLCHIVESGTNSW